jgi:hypothetical protein
VDGEGETRLLVLAGNPYNLASFLNALLLLSASGSRLNLGSGMSPGLGMEPGSGFPTLEDLGQSVPYKHCGGPTHIFPPRVVEEGMNPTTRPLLMLWSCQYILYSDSNTPTGKWLAR